MYSEDNLLMLSGLQHLSFCERQWALIHIEQQWKESLDTVRGDVFHEKAHLIGYSTKKSIISVRSLPLTSFKLGLTGIADIVEFIEDTSGTYTSKNKAYRVLPVEYKVGKPKIEDWDRIQVCAQALCLEEMHSCSITEGALFYGKTRRREEVILDEALRNKVITYAERMHELFETRKTPKVAQGTKCKRCSLKEVCLPRALKRNINQYWDK